MERLLDIASTLVILSELCNTHMVYQAVAPKVVSPSNNIKSCYPLECLLDNILQYALVPKNQR